MMILDQVMRRKMQAVSLDDTLQVAARKLRELDHVVSPIVEFSEELDWDDSIQVPASDENLRLFAITQSQKRLGGVIPMRPGGE